MNMVNHLCRCSDLDGCQNHTHAVLVVAPEGIEDRGLERCQDQTEKDRAKATIKKAKSKGKPIKLCALAKPVLAIGRGLTTCTQGWA